MKPTAAANLCAAAAALLLFTVFALLAGNAGIFAEILRSRIVLCLQTLIPSLFGCMALTDLLTASGAAVWLGGRLRPLARLLRLPPELLTVFLVSQIAGYPVGTLLLRQMAERGRLSQEDTAALSGACFGGGPAFLVGLAGVQMFGSAAAGWLMLGACICANFCILMLVRPKSQPEPAIQDVPVRLSAECVTGAVSRTMRSLAGICGMVLLFGILMQLCEALGITALLIRLGAAAGIPAQTVRALFAAVLDITQLHRMFACGLSFRLLLAVSAALLSFGGICVHWQCLALGGGALHGGRLLGMRLIAALLTFLLTFAAAGSIPLPESAAVFAARTAVSKSGSILPSLLIFCTGFPFLIKKD